MTQALAALVVALAFASSHAAAEESERRFAEQRNFGLGAQAGLYTGFGGGFRAGGSRAGGELSGGWVPIVLNADRDDEDPLELELHSTGQLNAETWLRIARAGRRADFGLQGGYKYNTLLGHGGGIGGYAHVDLARRIGLHILGGLLVFPDAEDRLRDEVDVEDTFPGHVVQLQVSVRLLFYP